LLSGVALGVYFRSWIDLIVPTVIWVVLIVTPGVAGFWLGAAIGGLWGFDKTETPLMSYGLSSLSMVMVAVGTFIAGRYVFRDGFAYAGWSWGKPKHYLAVFGLVILVWVVPTALELALGMRSLPAGLIATEVLAVFVLRFVATLIPAFGEEFGWRDYMLPRLARRYSVRWALLLHAFIWWAWHLPTLVGFGARTEGVADPVLGVAVVLLISIIPSMMHAVIYAYIWSSSQSLAVATVYHSAFDETRDALETSVGFGPFVDVIWQNVVLTLLGALLLWKATWKHLTGHPSSQVQPQTGTYLRNEKTS
jgi:membrane protease YdiL (CAAX protease family)